VAYGDGGRTVIQTRLSVTWRRNSRTEKDDWVQIALEACIFCSSFPVWKMRLTVNPVVSFSATELVGIPRRRRAKYFEEANVNERGTVTPYKETRENVFVRCFVSLDVHLFDKYKQQHGQCTL